MIGILFLTLGAANAALAMSVETCTQGDAASLYAGFLTLFLYLLGAAALAVRPPPRATLAALLPAAGLAAWHSVFAVRFAWGYFAQDMSACFAMQGGFSPEDAGEWMDGGETLLAWLWLSLSGVFWIAAAAALWRTKPDRQPDA